MRKQFKFTPYSERRRKQRGITNQMIEEALERPDYVKKSYEGRKMAFKKIHGGTLVVIFEERENYIRIITLYYE